MRNGAHNAGNAKLRCADSESGAVAESCAGKIKHDNQQGYERQQIYSWAGMEDIPPKDVEKNQHKCNEPGHSLT
ncbi:MAG TPA: hypothetical protein VNG71_17325 [Pyrinomonadaceae bacterium]|nr:hypothetical protein [Pyrinomonadaceae bacterium]